MGTRLFLGLAVIAAVLTAPLTANAAEPGLDHVWQRLFARPSVVPSPPGNPWSAAKADLGERLFRDVRLSGDGNRSCATCHRPDKGFTDGRLRGQALDGSDLAHNVPGLLDLAWATRLFWDGRASSLEDQAAAPILSPSEMAGSWPTILAGLAHDPAMPSAFAEAFGSPSITPERIVMALAAYERTLLSPPSRFDRFIAGDAAALSAPEVEGFRLFVGRAGCVACHVGWRFTDGRSHDIGLPARPGATTPGPATSETTAGDRMMRTPGLRGLTTTAPYMHDGSLPTLAAVVDHYADGVVPGPALAAALRERPRLTADDRANLVAFLRAIDAQ